MPRRARRARLKPVMPPGALNETQRQILLHGADFGFRDLAGEPGFASEAEMRAAWIHNRAELMSECQRPGMRPWAFFRFELATDVRFAIEGFEALDLAVLLSPDEARMVENSEPILAAEHAASDPETYRASLRQMYHGSANDAALLALDIGRFEIAARWHARRGRAEAEEMCRTLAEIARDFAEQEKTS